MPGPSRFTSRPFMTKSDPLFPADDEARSEPAGSTSPAAVGPSDDAPKFFILDAFSLIYQVYHAIDEMTGPAGQPTHAVFGIVRDLLNITRELKPDYLAAAFDGINDWSVNKLIRERGQRFRQDSSDSAMEAP